ncbi:MAG: hypothetical protein HQL29_04790 [Candidatus Omnitrophica bacterium]|nr:hypothetical protein [Candidatus Omnitrophota bacterium]
MKSLNVSTFNTAPVTSCFESTSRVCMISSLYKYSITSLAIFFRFSLLCNVSWKSVRRFSLIS